MATVKYFTLAVVRDRNSDEFDALFKKCMKEAASTLTHDQLIQAFTHDKKMDLQKAA